MWQGVTWTMGTQGVEAEGTTGWGMGRPLTWEDGGDQWGGVFG